MEWRSWLPWLPPRLYRLVIVNLKSDSDTAIRCVLWDQRGAYLIVRQAALVKANAPAVPMDGEVLIPRDNVAFVQVLPDAGR